MSRAKIVLLGALAVLSLALSNTEAADARLDSLRGRPGTFVINRATPLYAEPSMTAGVVTRLKPRTVIEVVEVTDQWYRVRSSAGRRDGFVRRSYADPFSREARDQGGGSRGSGASGSADGGSGERMRFKVGIFELVEPSHLRAEPSMDAEKIATLREGAKVRVVDKNGSWYKVASDDPRKPPAYVPVIAVKRVGDAAQ